MVTEVTVQAVSGGGLGVLDPPDEPEPPELPDEPLDDPDDPDPLDDPDEPLEDPDDPPDDPVDEPADEVDDCALETPLLQPLDKKIAIKMLKARAVFTDIGWPSKRRLASSKSVPIVRHWDNTPVLVTTIQ